jgi:exodeoxyribonuclease VII small subunit
MTRKKKSGNGAEAPPEGMTFEAALARLEAIVEEMEGGELGLEDMMARFEEGQKLAKLCSAKLNEVERKVEILVKKGAEVVAEPFEPEDVGEAEEGKPQDKKHAETGNLF